MSKEQIEKMVSDAEKFKAEDDRLRERTNCRIKLETYCFNMKTTIEERNVKDKLSRQDFKANGNACDKALRWLDSHQTTEVEEVRFLLLSPDTWYPHRANVFILNPAHQLC